MLKTTAARPTKHEFLILTRATTIKDLISYGVENKCTHVWVMPSCRLEFTEQQADVDGTGKYNGPSHWYSVSTKKEGVLMLDGSQAKENMVVSATGYRRMPKSSAKIHIIFFAQSRWSILPADDPERLEAMAAEIEQSLGVELSGAPTTVGKRFLDLKNKRYGDEYFAKPTHFTDYLLQEGQQVPINWDIFKKLGQANNAINWFPKLTEEQLEGMTHLHCFDRNSSHPYAASKSKFGIGNPVRVGAIDFDHLAPGYWNVEIEGYEELCKDLPPLLPDSRVSLPTPLVKMVRDRGCTIKVQRAMIWSDKEHRAPIFERWGNDLWALRERYQAGSLERQAIKLIMNSTVGYTRHGDAYDEDFRSDWYDQIVAEERAVVWYRAWKIANEHGIYAVGCYHDALYYLSASSDPASIPDLLKPNTFGGYKCDWTLEITPAVRKVLLSKKAPNYRIGDLKKLVASQKGAAA